MSSHQTSSLLLLSAAFAAKRRRSVAFSGTKMPPSLRPPTRLIDESFCLFIAAYAAAIDEDGDEEDPPSLYAFPRNTAPVAPKLSVPSIPASFSTSSAS